ncbi:hypothetical protein OBK04_11940 [Empedobacter falsenii]
MSKEIERLVSAGLGQINPTQTFNELVALYKETTSIIETEKTKREEIVADKEARIETIKAQKEVLMAYLDKTFDERSVNFNKIFEVIDAALENDNIQQLALGLDSLNKLAAESPFKVFTDINTLGEALDNKTEFDI